MIILPAMTHAQEQSWLALLEVSQRLVVKAAAHSVPQDVGRRRHLVDIAVLTTLITRQDQIRENLKARDRSYLHHALTAMNDCRPEWVGIAGAEQGVDRLQQLIAHQ